MPKQDLRSVALLTEEQEAALCFDAGRLAGNGDARNLLKTPYKKATDQAKGSLTGCRIPPRWGFDSATIERVTPVALRSRFLFFFWRFSIRAF
jgi:hypothetical protein